MKAVEMKGLTLPPLIVKLMAMEYRSIVADFLFVRVSQFYGGKVGENIRPEKEDWQWFYRNLDLVTELDPWFQDPYYLGNGMLTWDAKMYKEANLLLKKATDARTWDWWFPFMLGFNKFYFLGENHAGAEYLLKAYERPGAWTFLPSLAARLYHDDRKTDNAITFLTGFWENEKDAKVKKNYAVRIDALKKIAFLEQAVLRFRLKFGWIPENMDKILIYGIIKGVPKDPYGGKFYIAEDGAIKTTSKLAFATIERQKKEALQRQE
jgi:hypothetical protein